MDTAPEFDAKKNPVFIVGASPSPNFGKYAILSNAEYHLEQEPDWWWKFRPTTSIDDLEYARFLDEFYKTHEPRPDDWVVAAWRQLAISFAGTNIPSDKDMEVVGQSVPILQVGATIDEVENVVKQMPLNLIAELWIALGKANPLYGPPSVKENQPEETSAQPTNSES